MIREDVVVKVTFGTATVPGRRNDALVLFERVELVAGEAGER